MKKLTAIAFVLAIAITEIQAQEQKPRLINRKSAGLLTEYGLPYYYLPEGSNRYYVLLVGGVFGLPFYKTPNFFNVSVDFYPHFGYVWVKDCRFIEFGLNIRLGLNFEVSEKNIICVKIASGPHYMNCETEKQANGFIFSDYYLVTYKRGLKISKADFTFDFEFGYRHISNAGFKEPNRSISNFIFGLGFYRSF